MKLTAAGSGYFIVSVNGAEVSKHVTEREAIEACVNREFASPDDVVEYRHDYRVKVEEAVPAPEPTPVPVPPPTGFTTLLSWPATAFNLPSYEIKGGASIDAGAMKVTSIAGGQGDKGYKHLFGRVHQIQFGKTYRNTWQMRFDPGLVWSNNRTMKIARWVRTDGGAPINVLTCFMGSSGFSPAEHGAGFISDQGAGAGDDGPTIFYNLNPATNPAITNWQTYQIDLRVQSAPDARDGLMIVRVNGAEVGRITGIRWFSGTIPLWNAWGGFGMFFFPQDANGVLWTKDIVIEAN